jgi:hypothetical protein
MKLRAIWPVIMTILVHTGLNRIGYVHAHPYSFFGDATELDAKFLYGRDRLVFLALSRTVPSTMPPVTAPASVFDDAFVVDDASADSLRACKPRLTQWIAALATKFECDVHIGDLTAHQTVVKVPDLIARVFGSARAMCYPEATSLSNTTTSEQTNAKGHELHVFFDGRTLTIDPTQPASHVADRGVLWLGTVGEMGRDERPGAAAEKTHYYGNEGVARHSVYRVAAMQFHVEGLADTSCALSSSLAYAHAKPVHDDTPPRMFVPDIGEN